MRLVRAIIGLLLIPCCVAVSKTVFFLISSFGTFSGQIPSAPVLAVIAGLTFWILVFIFLPRPVRTYVLAHELTHAFWGTVLGARVSGIRVSKTGGQVKLSAHNFFTVLAPYFFPLYTVVAILLYSLLSIFFDFNRYYLLWLGLIGFTLGFHFSFTIVALSTPQNDIREYGRLFSYTVIYLFNMLVIAVLIIMVSSFVTLELFMRRLVMDMTDTWKWCGSALWGYAQQLYSMF